jgi:hypothetical protein
MEEQREQEANQGQDQEPFEERELDLINSILDAQNRLEQAQKAVAARRPGSQSELKRALSNYWAVRSAINF